MNVDYVARQATLDDSTREWAEKKLAKLEKYLREEIQVRVVLNGEGNRNRVELRVDHRHGSIQASEEAADFKAAINLAVDKAEKQARRELKKFQDTRRRAPKATGEDTL
jgi:putative sigma-54 modulation protein